MVSAVNKTYGKSIFRTIKSSLSRFLAILAIVALGVGFLAGLLSSPGDMRVSADHYYDESRMYDARVLSTLGLTEDDLEAVKAVDGVEAVMPVYDTDLVLVSEGEDASSYTTRMHSLPQDTSAESENYLNQLTLVEGRMPEKSGEIVVVLTKSFTGGESWIGQTLRQDPDGEAVDGLPEEFTVVGTVKSAMYLSMENESTTAGSGSLGLLAYTVPLVFLVAGLLAAAPVRSALGLTVPQDLLAVILGLLGLGLSLLFLRAVEPRIPRRSGWRPQVVSVTRKSS